MALAASMTLAELPTEATGKRGSTLRWLPQPTSEYAVKQASATEPVGPRLAQYQPPKMSPAMSDPFDEPPPRATPGEVPSDAPEARPVPGFVPGEDPGYRSPRSPLLPPRDNGLLPLPRPDRSLSPVPDNDTGPNVLQRKCPTKEDPEYADFFKTIKDLSIDIAAKDGDFPIECGLAYESYQPRCWSQTCYMWKASALCHKPLYFEETQLERYGHTCSCLLQPIVSGAHFFATVPILPYKMGLEPPSECIYSLGYYRPGNCAPHLLDPIPISARAGLIQAGAVVGAAAIIP